MNINGLLIHANPEKRAEVAQSLTELAGVELHEVTDDGRFVVTVEDIDGSDPGEVFIKIDRMEGVLSAALVFHHRETNESAGPAAA